MQTRLLLVIILSLLAATSHGQEKPKPTPLEAVRLDTLLARPNLWESTPDELDPDLTAMQFQWNSTARDSARSVYRKMTMANRRVTEALLYFTGGKLSEITCIYYDHSDGKYLWRNEFEKLKQDITDNVTKLAKVQPVNRGRDMSNAAKAEGLQWITPTTEYLLEWNVVKESAAKKTPFRADFVRLRVTPHVKTVVAIGAKAAVTTRDIVKAFVPGEHVDRETSGIVKIADIPMVDQGAKGYCVVAAMERVLRYYGAKTDTLELARIAGASATYGTSLGEMTAALTKLNARLGLRMKLIYSCKAAPGAPAPVRARFPGDCEVFQQAVKARIDEGRPVLWAVELGVVKESDLDPQVKGGHMRLIFGYDESTLEFLYTDTWGAGHEEKRMSYEDAWKMTYSAYVLEPTGY